MAHSSGCINPCLGMALACATVWRLLEIVWRRSQHRRKHRRKHRRLADWLSSFNRQPVQVALGGGCGWSRAAGMTTCVRSCSAGAPTLVFLLCSLLFTSLRSSPLSYSPRAWALAGVRRLKALRVCPKGAPPQEGSGCNGATRTAIGSVRFPGTPHHHTSLGVLYDLVC